jgi:hypothetical protein
MAYSRASFVTSAMHVTQDSTVTLITGQQLAQVCMPSYISRIAVSTHYKHNAADAVLTSDGAAATMADIMNYRSLLPTCVRTYTLAEKRHCVSGRE